MSTSIEIELSNRMKDAMKARDQRTLDVIRMIRSKILEAKTAKGFSGVVDDALYIDVIAKYTKQMSKAIQEYESQGDRGREMVDQLRFEIDYLSDFLPKKFDVEETRAIVRQKIAELLITDAKKSGQLIGAVMKEHKDSVDAEILKNVVQQELAIIVG